MYEFNAVATSLQTIQIDSNTYWSCKAEGNFKLSQYDGSGSTIIDVIIPEDELFVDGNVYFSYGDERCMFPVLPIYYTNDCYIKTNPLYRECGEDKTKTIYFYYDYPGQLFTVNVIPVDEWEAVPQNDVKIIVDDNDLTLIAPKNNGTVLIKPTKDCGGKNEVTIRLIKNPD